MKTSVLNKFLSSYYPEESHPAIIKRVDLFGCCHSIDKSLCLVAHLDYSGLGRNHTFLDLVLLYADGDYHILRNFTPSDSFDTCMYSYRLSLCQLVS